MKELAVLDDDKAKTKTSSRVMTTTMTAARTRGISPHGVYSPHFPRGRFYLSLARSLPLPPASPLSFPPFSPAPAPVEDASDDVEQQNVGQRIFVVRELVGQFRKQRRASSPADRHSLAYPFLRRACYPGALPSTRRRQQHPIYPPHPRHTSHRYRRSRRPPLVEHIPRCLTPLPSSNILHRRLHLLASQPERFSWARSVR